MKLYKDMTAEELKLEYDKELSAYNDFKSQNLSLDMSRGKPAANQLDLSNEMFDIFNSNSSFTLENKMDARNYGLLDGLPETKRLFAEVLEVTPNNILVGGNSSLNMMFDSISRSMTFGVNGSLPWSKLDRVKFLCPVPGYDRHFAICELFGIEMINIPMDGEGPDVEMIKRMAEADSDIKGIWCVPKYSNPTGVTYSDRVVKALASLKPAAPDFRIYWDNAYCIHDLYAEGDKLLNIFDECKKNGNEDMVLEFASTSKISFSGAGVAVMAASENNLNYIKKILTVQTIGHDKLNQLRHARYFDSASTLKAHMAKHAALIAPKFEVVFKALDSEIVPLGIGSYFKPKGGYFVSFDAMNGCASRIGELCKDAGLVLTTVGATFPYGKDEFDKNIRIAPTYPTVPDLEKAMELFCTAVKLASIEALTK